MLTDNQRKAERAEQLLKDPLLNDALCAIRKSCYDQIASTALDEPQKREDLYLLLKACELFEGEFVSFINRGKLDNLNGQQKLNRLTR